MQNDHFFYQKVKYEVALGRLKMIGIIAPARSGSTFLMNALAQSPSVHGFVNQPFHLTYSFPYLPPGNREEVAYQRIWRKYQQAREIHCQDTIILVLKCMARNLGIGNQALRFIQLMGKLIVLIRNPFLTVDSLLKEQVMVIEDMPEASRQDFDEYAYQRDFIDPAGQGCHWQVLRDFLLRTKHYQIITDLLIETLAFIELNRYEIEMTNDYKCCFKHNFDNSRYFFALSWTGWSNMAVIYEEHISKAENYLVVDSTIIRCIPEKVCREMSDALDITYSPYMIDNWRLDRDQIIDPRILKVSWMQGCYDRVARSSGIKRPNDTPIPIHLFPPLYQQHILNTAQPLYSTLLNDNHSVRPRSHEEIDELLGTTVTEDGKVLKQVDPILTEILVSFVF